MPIPHRPSNLNGTSSVLYGTVPELVATEQREKAFGIFYTGTIGAGALAATGARAQAPRALRAIYPTRSTSSWAFYIAREAGIYAQHGLDVKLDFGVHPVGLAGLVSGEVHFTNYSVDDTAAAALRDASAFVVYSSILSKASFAIGAGMVSQLPVLASSVYHWKDGGTGMLLGARGLGAGLGPIIAARFTRGKVSRVLQVCGIAGLSCSFFYLFTGVAPVIYLAALCIALAHLGGGSQWTLSPYGLQLRTPDHIRGRVLAGDFAIVTLVMTLSGLGAGALSSAAGVRPTIITFSLVGGLAGFAYLRYTKPIIARLRAAEEATAT